MSMNMINERFNTLRALLHSEPSSDAWRSTWDLLGRWRGDSGFELGLEYATQALATWPDALRELPRADADAPWGDDPRWSLVRSIDVHEGWAKQPLPPMQWVTRVRITRGGRPLYEELERLLSDERTPRLKAIHVVGGDADGLERPLARGAWPRLVELRFVNIGLEDRQLSRLVGRSLPSLELLDVSDNPLTDRAVADLIHAAEGWPHLRALLLHRTRIGEQGLLAVSAAPAFRRLSALGFDGLKLTEATWRALIASPMLGNSATLGWLRDQHLGDAVIEHLAKSPHMAQVRHLDLTGNTFSHRAARALSRSPHLRQLETLAMGHNDLGPDAVQALLAAAEALPRLKRLELVYNEAGDLGASLIGRSARLPQLTHLDLRYNGIGDAGARELLQLEGRLPRLSHLDLRGNPIRDKGARALARALQQRSLERLHLDVEKLSGAAVQTLAAAPAVVLLGERSMARFKPDSDRVNLSGRHIGDEGALALSRSPHMAHVRHLSLAANQITDLGVTALANSPHLKRLEHLDLSSNRVGVEGLQALASSTHLRALEHLGLSRNELTAEHVEALLKGARHDLTSLDLSHNHLGIAAARVLAQGVALAHLTRLDLSHNRLGPDAVEALGASVALTRLMELSLDHNHLGDLGVERLSRSERTNGLLHLGLRHNAISPEGARLIAQSPASGGLAHLDLRDNPLGDEGIEALAFEPSRLTSLSELLVDIHRLTERGWRALAKAPFVANCERLEMFAGQGLSDDVALALARSPHFRGVRHLDLSGNRFSGEALKALFAASGFSSLKTLNLSRNPLGDEAAAILIGGQSAHHLEGLDLSHTSLTDIGATHLAQANRLKVLNVAWNMLTDEAIGLFVGQQTLPTLEELDVSGNLLSADGVLMLARSPLVRRLKRLGVDNVPMSAEALRALPEHVEPSYMAYQAWHWYGGESEDEATASKEQGLHSTEPRKRPKSQKAMEEEALEWRRERVKKRQDAKKERQKQQRARDKERAKTRRPRRGRKKEF